MKLIKDMKIAEVEDMLERFIYATTDCKCVVEIVFDFIYIRTTPKTGGVQYVFNIDIPEVEEECLFNKFEDFLLFITTGMLKTLIG